MSATRLTVLLYRPGLWRRWLPTTSVLSGSWPRHRYTVLSTVALRSALATVTVVVLWTSRCGQCIDRVTALTAMLAVLAELPKATMALLVETVLGTVKDMLSMGLRVPLALVVKLPTVEFTCRQQVPAPVQGSACERAVTGCFRRLTVYRCRAPWRTAMLTVA